MAAFPRRGVVLRNGQPCGRTAATDSELCVHHTQLLESFDAESLQLGNIPKKRTLNEPALRVITAPTVHTSTTESRFADPATVGTVARARGRRECRGAEGVPARGGRLRREACLAYGRVRRLR